MTKQKRDAPSKKIQLIALLVVMATTSTIYGCREQPDRSARTAPAPVAASADAAITPTPGK